MIFIIWALGLQRVLGGLTLNKLDSANCVMKKNPCKPRFEVTGILSSQDMLKKELIVFKTSSGFCRSYKHRKKDEG